MKCGLYINRNARPYNNQLITYHQCVSYLLKNTTIPCEIILAIHIHRRGILRIYDVIYERPLSPLLSSLQFSGVRAIYPDDSRFRKFINSSSINNIHHTTTNNKNHPLRLMCSVMLHILKCFYTSRSYIVTI